MQSFIYDLRKVPVIRVLLPFLMGLIACEAAFDNLAILPVLCLFLSGLILLLLMLMFHSRKKKVLFGVASISCMLLIGVIFAALSMKSFSGQFDGKIVEVQGTVIDPLLVRQKSRSVKLRCKFFITDDSIQSVKQNMIVYFPLNDTLPVMIPGEEWYFHGTLQAIRNNGNPGEFDYRSYMHRRNYAYTMHAEYYVRMQTGSSSYKYLPSRIRMQILATWKKHTSDISVLSALTLGYKSMLESNLKQSFSNAGAMHLLAVSGLHVGMIWWILNVLIRVPSQVLWVRIKGFIIIGILWFYAGITGFSESVTRSVTMFSLVSLALSMKRPSSIYNTVLLSALILLLLKPDRILDAGFQLSYVAVLGIISLQPLFSRRVEGKNKLLKWITDLITVSIAAQIGTLPLVLYYFHQFPVWFLLTNVAAIPIVSLLLALFVLLSPFFVLFPDIAILTLILQKLTWLLIQVVEIIASLPFSVLEIAPVSKVSTLLLGCIVFFLVLFWYYRGFKIFYLMGCSILLFVYSSAIRIQIDSGKKSLSCLNTRSATVITAVHSGERITYVYEGKDEINQFDKELVQKLDGIPSGLRKHEIVYLDMAYADSLNTSCQLADELLGILVGSFHILIAGDCDPDHLTATLRMYKWDMLVLSKGFPKRSVQELNRYPSLDLVGDSRLRSYEYNYLAKEVLRNIRFTREGRYTVQL
ncbi:ComEC/Rec2 family competence protein [Bacteroidota bacterium]